MNRIHMILDSTVIDLEDVSAAGFQPDTIRIILKSGNAVEVSRLREQKIMTAMGPSFKTVSLAVEDQFFEQWKEFCKALAAYRFKVDP